MEKTAVVLFNLGGPDSRGSIRPFLFNFFMDKNIVRIPMPFRFLLAQWISYTRARGAALKNYGYLGYKSPLLENTKKQGAALEKRLNAKDTGVYKVFVSMRYWHPFAREVVRDINAYRPQHLVFLPLYPQFSTTTIYSSLENFRASVQKDNGWLHSAWEKDVTVSGICCYPLNEGFISAAAENIAAALESALHDGYETPRVLFSAHGLPESVITDGDPYQWQCEQGAAKIAAALGLEDWAMCYQSRVGKQKWIGPSTEEELRRAAKDSKAVILYPIAFTQEHVETLVEIEIEYRELAQELGLPRFYRVPTVSTHPAFIEDLAGMIENHRDKKTISGENGTRICPANFRRCCMQA